MIVKLIVTYEAEIEDKTEISDLKDMLSIEEIMEYFKEADKTLIIEGL